MAVSALAVVLVAAIAVPALAGQPAPRNTTVQAVGKVTFKANRFIKDSLHWNRDTVVIRRGGNLTIRDRTRQPHSFSLVRRNQLPRNLRQMENCFGPGPCDDLAVDHGAVNPDTGEEQEPTVPLVNVGPEGFNQPGDSVYLPPGRRVRVEVTGRNDKYYLCAIHPWMLGKIDVRG